MNLFEKAHSDILEAVTSLQKKGVVPVPLDVSKITVESPRDPLHGDIATNAAMVLSKQAGMNPRALAEHLQGELQSLPPIEKAEIAGPGFINLTLGPSFWVDQLRSILEKGQDYGRSDFGQGMRLGIEFLSANPTGPLHIGHTRGAVLGDTFVKLFRFVGYNVRGDYYINDGGAQMDTLARSVYLRYKEALGQDIGTIPEGLYPGDYLIPFAKTLAAEFGDKWVDQDESQWLDLFRTRSCAAMMALIHEDLEILGVKHDVFTSERKLVEDGKPLEAIAHLKELGLIYEGTVEPPLGMDTTNWVKETQLIFKATAYGDDKDRVLVKGDGSFTYLVPDIAYHYAKFHEGLEGMIVILGEDHIGYVKRLKATTNAVTDGKINLEVLISQIVNLLRDGAGTIVTLRELIDEIGVDAVRFSMLTRRHDMVMDVDLKKVVEQSKDNPLFYVQYAHARVCSVLRQASDLFPGMDLTNTKGDVLLDDEAEINLIKFMATWPRVVRQAVESREAHRIAHYVTDLAGHFHSLWNRGMGATHLRFIHENDVEKTKSKLLLVRGVKNVITIALGLMGIKAVERM